MKSSADRALGIAIICLITLIIILGHAIARS